MKSIELTKEHKLKLLEMCKKLFPEIVVQTDYSDNWLEDKLWWETGKHREYKGIHWFEFCMTHLADKVIYLEIKKLRSCQGEHEEMLMQLMKNFYGENGIHPINYLYEEFKKLK